MSCWQANRSFIPYNESSRCWPPCPSANSRNAPRRFENKTLTNCPGILMRCKSSSWGFVSATLGLTFGYLRDICLQSLKSKAPNHWTPSSAAQIVCSIRDHTARSWCEVVHHLLPIEYQKTNSAEWFHFNLLLIPVLRVLSLLKVSVSTEGKDEMSGLNCSWPLYALISIDVLIISLFFSDSSAFSSGLNSFTSSWCQVSRGGHFSSEKINIPETKKRKRCQNSVCIDNSECLSLQRSVK